MKKRLLKIFNTKRGLNITDIRALLPEIQGSDTYFLPTGEGQNKNIILIDNVNEEFIGLMNLFLATKKIKIKFVEPMIYISENSPMYWPEPPLAQEEDMDTQKLCWLSVQVWKLTAKSKLRKV